MMSKIKKLCRWLFRQLFAFGRRALHWLLKKMIRIVNKYPSINIFLKKNLSRFPRLENYLYYFHRHYMLKISQPTPLSLPQENAVEGLDLQKYSMTTEKVYQQLMHLKRINKL